MIGHRRNGGGVESLSYMNIVLGGGLCGKGVAHDQEGGARGDGTAHEKKREVCGKGVTYVKEERRGSEAKRI